MKAHKLSTLAVITHSIYSPLAFAPLLASASGSMMAQVHYQGDQPWSQRADSGPDAEVPGWYYNLGLTGIRAALVAHEPKALLVKHVLPKSPARNAIKVDNLIIGAEGKEFSKPCRRICQRRMFLSLMI